LQLLPHYHDHRYDIVKFTAIAISSVIITMIIIMNRSEKKLERLQLKPGQQAPFPPMPTSSPQANCLKILLKRGQKVPKQQKNSFQSIQLLGKNAKQASELFASHGKSMLKDDFLHIC
jgi:hypothetical protein